MEQSLGKVYLIGAGPGDPGLITVKGRDALERADVVVYDYLANEDFLRLCRPGAERIYVGKRSGRHTLSQDEICALLVERARSGADVARLKGGDPYIFGRGGEEAEALEEAGVPFEVIPGVSSAVAAPAYAGIPLTHRKFSSSVAVITGHEDSAKGGSRIRWNHLARGADTLVFLMGMKNLEMIARNLVKGGRKPGTPAAVIRWGTTPRQRTVVSSLDRIADETRLAGMTPPAVLVVGDVVRLRSRLAFYEQAPLFGRRIAVTRTRHQASRLSRCLRELGAEVFEFPTISILEPESWDEVDRALQRLDRYDWMVFTSANGVRFFLGRLWKIGGDARSLSGIRVAAIGPGTEEALAGMGIRPDLVPREYRAEPLADAIAGEGVRGKRVLIPRALEAREILPERLMEMGAQVDVLTVYKTVRPDGEVSRLRSLLERGEVDAVTFTSSSTVRNFVRMFPRKDLPGLLEKVAAACIGPVTARSAEQEGIRPRIVARQYTIPGLVEALVEFFHHA